MYRKDALLARFDADVLMPDVRHLIAGVYYADLRGPT
jgi:hypothetical protein